MFHWMLRNIYTPVISVPLIKKKNLCTYFWLHPGLTFLHGSSPGKRDLSKNLLRFFSCPETCDILVSKAKGQPLPAFEGMF